MKGGWRCAGALRFKRGAWCPAGTGGAEEPAMRSILFGIIALLVLIVVSALSALILVPSNSAGPGLQVLLPSAHAQGVGKSQGHVPQAPVGHRQPTAPGAENVRENS